MSQKIPKMSKNKTENAFQCMTANLSCVIFKINLDALLLNVKILVYHFVKKSRNCEFNTRFSNAVALHLGMKSLVYHFVKESRNRANNTTFVRKVKSIFQRKMSQYFEKSRLRKQTFRTAAFASRSKTCKFYHFKNRTVHVCNFMALLKAKLC